VPVTAAVFNYIGCHGSGRHGAQHVTPWCLDHFVRRHVQQVMAAGGARVNEMSRSTLRRTFYIIAIVSSCLAGNSQPIINHSYHRIIPIRRFQLYNHAQEYSAHPRLSVCVCPYDRTKALETTYQTCHRDQSRI